METKYRIFPNRRCVADMYLQFKDGEEWRYVPREKVMKVLGSYLSVELCPTVINIDTDNRMIGCFIDQESYDLIPFAKKWKNIEDYFEHGKICHQEYLKNEERKNNAQIIYL